MQQTTVTSARMRLTAVVPCFNEIEVLEPLHARLFAALDALDAHVQVLYVDDGSTDGTGARLVELAHADPRVGVLLLSRNFGKEAALTAGLDHAQGDAVVVLDADLQDPPELIAEFVARFREGYDVVYGRRVKREATLFMQFAYKAFYRVAWMQRSGIRESINDSGFHCEQWENFRCRLG